MSTLLNILLDRIYSEVEEETTTVYFGEGYRVKVDTNFSMSYTGCRIYTDGLKDYDHPEFEIVFPMAVKSAALILKRLADSVAKCGDAYGHGYTYKKNNVPIYQLIQTPYDSLRIIIPDNNNKIDYENMDRIYALQFEYRRLKMEKRGASYEELRVA